MTAALTKYRHGNVTINIPTASLAHHLIRINAHDPKRPSITLPVQRLGYIAGDGYGLVEPPRRGGRQGRHSVMDGA
ncbi:MAG: hypothetical protein R3B91_13960 [Planctomycetaceae bacterium]